MSVFIDCTLFSITHTSFGRETVLSNVLNQVRYETLNCIVNLRTAVYVRACVCVCVCVCACVYQAVTNQVDLCQ